MRTITAEVISIGDELLIGQTINTNAGWLGQRLGFIGIRTVQVTTIGDQAEAIIGALERTTADLVVITGGLGPTKDDITKHTLCEWFGTELKDDPGALARVEDFLDRVGATDPTVRALNRKQAELPISCTVLPNMHGSASGMWFERDGRVFISLPGVPWEMAGIMDDHGFAALREYFRTPVITHRTVQIFGIGESALALRIADWEDALARADIHLAYLPAPGVVKLRLSQYGANDAAAAQLDLERYVRQLPALIGEARMLDSDRPLEEEIGRLLLASQATLATAESCTGGNISRMITAVPGSSAYFIGGFVTYANAVKMEELGVPGDMLELNGAVSRPVVERMALGVRGALATDWAVAVSGIAGPGGGAPGKPVGTVWMAVAGPDGVHAQCRRFSGDRGLVVERASMAVLEELRSALLRHQGVGVRDI